MRFTSTVAGETIDVLVARSYSLGSTPSNAMTEQAHAALIDANPFLSALDAVPDGTVVAIPDVRGVEISDQALSSEQAAVAVTGDQLGGALGLAARNLMASIAGGIDAASGSLQEFGGPEITKLAEANEQLSQALPQLIQTATARVEAGRQLEEYSKVALAQFEQDLQALQGAFGTR